MYHNVSYSSIFESYPKLSEYFTTLVIREGLCRLESREAMPQAILIEEKELHAAEPQPGGAASGAGEVAESQVSQVSQVRLEKLQSISSHSCAILSASWIWISI